MPRLWLQSLDDQFGERAGGSGVLPCEEVAVDDCVGLPHRPLRVLGRELPQFVLQQPLRAACEVDTGMFTDASLLLVAKARHHVVRERRVAVCVAGREESGRGVADDAEWLTGGERLFEQRGGVLVNRE